MAKKQAPQAEAQAPTPEAPTEAVQPISFEEPAAQLAEGVAFTDEPPVDTKPAEADRPVLTDAEYMAIRREAKLANEKRDFHDMIMKARTPKPEPVFVAPPLAPQVAEQTRLEIEAGKKRVAEHAAMQAIHRPAPAPDDGKVTPVFRPADYVPDQKKGQGYTDARSLNV